MKKGIFTRNLQGDSGNAGFKTTRFRWVIKLLSCIFLFGLIGIAKLQAQYTTTAPTIDASTTIESSAYANTYAGGGATYAVTWDATYLYVLVKNANETEPVSFIIDWNPVVPVNGGSNSDGTNVYLTGRDGISPTAPSLPFRADAIIYAHNTYREFLRSNGSNGWTSISTGSAGLTGATDDYSGDTNGKYASNNNGNGAGSDDVREFKISWDRLKGLTGGGHMPTSFNFLAFVSYSNGMYAQIPLENYGSNAVNSNLNGIVRYFTISNTANGTSTASFSQNSFTQPGVTNNSFGAISAYDFTMNSSGQQIARSGGDWTISGSLVVGAGTVYFGSGGTYGNSTVANVNVTGGTLNMDATNKSLNVSGNVTVASGATLTLSTISGGDLKSSGDFTNNGTFNANNRAVFFNGGNTQNINGTQTNINYVIIDKTGGSVNVITNLISDVLTITAGTLNVNAGKQLTVNTTLTNSGTLNLLSTSGGTATILTPATIAPGGTYNVYQYLSKSRNWYMSSPVSGATATVVDPAGSSNLLYLYNETLGGTSGWTAITSNATALTPGHGYVVKPAADGVTLNFTGGELNTGTTPSFSVSSTAAPDHAGYNLIGNPYPSYLYASTLVNSTANLDKSIWYRIQKNATTTFYFDTYNTAGNIGTNNSGNVNHISGTVAPMQSFWVHVSTALSSASINFNNSYRTHATALNDTVNPLKVKNQIATLQPALRLQVSNGINTDETVLYSNPAASNSFDAYDSPKMSNASVSIPEIYTLINTEQLAINGMNAIPVDTEMPLGFTTGTAGTFSMKASQFSNFVAGTKLILKDYLDINNPVIADLSDGSSYSFSSGITSNNTSRFALIFKAPSVTTALNDNANQKVWVSVNGANQIVVNGNSGIESTVAVYNAVGQKLLAKQLSGNTTVLNNSLGSGVYFVTVDVSGNKITKKVIINE